MRTPLANFLCQKKFQHFAKIIVGQSHVADDYVKRTVQILVKGKICHSDVPTTANCDTAFNHFCFDSDAGYEFDLCYTSVLKRAIRTLWFVLDGIDQMWLPVHRTWRLNERHYGGLTGLNKAETAAKHGEAQVKIWRRSFDIPPPPMDEEHPFYQKISKVTA